jgi:hypothetical protein
MRVLSIAIGFLFSFSDGRLHSYFYSSRGQGDDLVTEVIHCLSENRIRVTDFRTILPNLEDVFLKLTGHSIRD